MSAARGTPPRPGRTSQYPFFSAVEPKLMWPSGQRGVGSGGACAKVVKDRQTKRPVLLSARSGISPHRQFFAGSSDHEGVLRGTGAVASIFRESRRLHGNFIANL